MARLPQDREDLTLVVKLIQESWAYPWIFQRHIQPLILILCSRYIMSPMSNAGVASVLIISYWYRHELATFEQQDTHCFYSTPRLTMSACLPIYLPTLLSYLFATATPSRIILISALVASQRRNTDLKTPDTYLGRRKRQL